MRILILTDSFLPTLGGVQQHTYTLAHYLSKLSYEVHVVTSPSQNSGLDISLDRDLKELHKIDVFRKLPTVTNRHFVHTVQYVLACHNIAKYINKHANNYDIVHYHGTRQLFYRFVKSKTPIITSIHSIFPACVLLSLKQCEKRSAASCTICHINQWPEEVVVLPAMVPYYFSYNRMMQKSLKSVNKVVCVSEFVRKYVERFLNLDNLVTVYNFIDYEGEIVPQLKSLADFDIRNHLNLPSGAKVITYFGRLSSAKGIDLLIKAFGRVRKKVGDNIYLVIGGKGPQRMKLENMARRIGNVVFAGFVHRKIQLATIAQSDVFVHPARYPDACPTTILEATALGLPVIASRVGGNPELVVNGKGGYIVNPNSPTELATKISTVISDERFKSKARAFNLKWSRRFDITRLGPKIVELYEKALV